MRHLFAVGWMLGVEDFKSFWNWRSWTFGWLLRIVTSGLSLVLVGKLLGSAASLHYLLIGNIIISGCIGALFAVMATTWNRLDGTYPLLVIAPANLIPAVIGRSIVWMLQGIATSVAVLLIYSLIFGLKFSALQLALALLSIVLANLSTYGFAFFLGALVARLPSMRSVVFNSTGSLLAAFCGAAVPISFWPEALGWLIKLLPSTHALIAMRSAMAELEVTRIATELGYEGLIALLWAGLGAAIMTYMVNAGRADGSIQFE
ncbi:MAG: ABC transporter permease [Methylobacillus glycogenes]|nr:ABC transporter permease [Methylobacillus glycogenes]